MEGTTQSGAKVALYIEQELGVSYVSVEAGHIGFLRFNFNSDFPQDAKAFYQALLEVRSIVKER
jgi:hypothetical protein